MFKDLTEFFQCAVIGPSDSFLSGKSVLPDCTLRFIATANEDESFYVAALLNSAPCVAALYYSSVGVQTQRYHAADVEKIMIPLYEGRDSQRALVRLSKSCRDSKAKENLSELVAREAEIDNAAAKLWGITALELKAIQEALAETGRGKRSADTEEADGTE